MDKAKLLEILDRNIEQEKFASLAGAYILACVAQGKQFDVKELIKMIDECLDQEKLAKDLAVEVLLPIVEAKVVASPNKIDDVILVGLKRLLLA